MMVLKIAQALEPAWEESGFTLIELLIVVAILAVLAASPSPWWHVELMKLVHRQMRQISGFCRVQSICIISIARNIPPTSRLI